MVDALYSKTTLKHEPVNFRIEAIVSDGMWYSLTKWKKLAKVTDDELETWINTAIENGTLIQSETGARSYRVSHDFIINWYAKYGFDIKHQLVDFLFPPRIWGGMTETEGFLQAPLRELAIVSFVCTPKVAKAATEALRGVARVREDQPGSYRAYGLSSSYIKNIIKDVFAEYAKIDIGKIYSRAEQHRREMVDFNQEFASHIVEFYTQFGKTLAKREKETIEIFLPDHQDQKSQMIMWVLTAIEKFNEKSAVPFSGYLNSVLKRWPYDLPLRFLGKDLTVFQRERARALKRLREKSKDKNADKTFTAKQIAKEIGIALDEFTDLEDKHRSWIRAQNATTLTWGETADEKGSTSINPENDHSTVDDFELASELSFAIIDVALKTGLYKDAMILIDQLDSTEMDVEKLSELSQPFVEELGGILRY